MKSSVSMIIFLDLILTLISLRSSTKFYIIIVQLIDIMWHSAKNLFLLCLTEEVALFNFIKL